MTNTGPVVTPDLRAVLDDERTVNFAELNCHQVGRIVSFDAAKQSAVVQLVCQQAVFNTESTGLTAAPNPTVIPYPLLTDVPVFVPGGGGGFITFPIKAGDFCLVFFNDRDLDPWWSNGTTGALPNSARLHSLADGIALVGLWPAGAISAYSATDLALRIPGTGKFKVQNSGGTLHDLLVTTLGALLTALNAKTGPDCSAQITAFIAAANSLLS